MYEKLIEIETTKLSFQKILKILLPSLSICYVVEFIQMNIQKYTFLLSRILLLLLCGGNVKCQGGDTLEL